MLGIRGISRRKRGNFSPSSTRVFWPMRHCRTSANKCFYKDLVSSSTYLPYYGTYLDQQNVTVRAWLRSTITVRSDSVCCRMLQVALFIIFAFWSNLRGLKVCFGNARWVRPALPIPLYHYLILLLAYTCRGVTREDVTQYSFHLDTGIN